MNCKLNIWECIQWIVSWILKNQEIWKNWESGVGKVNNQLEIGKADLEKG